MTYKLGSLFDGSGGFPLAGFLCDIEPVWAAEIEPYPIAVTRTRFPMMKHYGDISKINGAEIEPVDIITFGSPCQDLSVAGKRAGLKHEDNGDEETTRSGLFMEAVRIIKEMREATNGKYPTFALWENVPGAFSSNKGEDFRIVLEELIKIVEPRAAMPAVPKKGWAYADSYVGDGWSLAYRVFDAQYWGVPQRRRRIYLVLDLGGERAREVLFEREGLRGYFTEGGTPWERTSAHAEGSLGTAGYEGTDPSALIAFAQNQRDEVRDLGSKAGALQAEPGMKQQTFLAQPITDEYILDDQGGQQISVRTDGKTPTLRAEMHGNVPCVMEAAGFCPEQSAKTRGIGYEKEMAPTMRAGVTPAVCVAETCTFEPGITNREGGHVYNGVAGMLRANAGDNQLSVCYSIENHPADSRVDIDESGKVQTLTGRMGTGGGNVPMVMEAVVFDGANVTSPINAANPKPGDPCHTLSTDSRNYVVESTPVYCLQGNGIDRADTAGCNGRGWNDETCYTLNTIDRPAVVYAGEPIVLDRAYFNQGQNALYEPQCYEDGTVPTLVARGPSAVAYWDGSQVCGTLTANNAGGSQRMPDKDNFNCVIEECTAELHEFIAEHNADVPHQQDLLQSADGVSRPLVAATHGAASHHTKTVINYGTHYIVRRLTPTECARLQGFADRWGDIDNKKSFSDGEYDFWLNVRNTHAEINGKAVKDYTKEQMLAWYKKLQSDSAEYKMWGNGISLPTALYCMQGIVDALRGNRYVEKRN